MAYSVKAEHSYMRNNGRKLKKHRRYSSHYPNDVSSRRGARENESALSFVRSAVRDRSHSYAMFPLVNSL